MTEELRENTLVQRILLTVIQVALIPMCITGTWAQLMPAGSDAQEQWQPINFLDAGYTRTGNYMSTIIVITCAVVAIVLCWTKAYGAAVLPSIIQTYTAVRVYMYFMRLKRSGEGMATRYGLIFMLVIFVGLMVAIWMRNEYIVERGDPQMTPEEMKKLEEARKAAKQEKAKKAEKPAEVKKAEVPEEVKKAETPEEVKEQEPPEEVKKPDEAKTEEKPAEPES